ncbi:MAG: LemA family protein [Bacteroidetes bacterium GWE2_40_63]|nr:MAG: LemA family protein [Bacteroidetes bacterium GWA2_40_14]OFX61951.1 MAG: LemA family protein [Bacteroidetes bacterium GWC2_40_13]OFX74098.1 MAG: LemA family protein [Bacteroidetes bacterium GWD2_40_43]OFX93068.1 MAG: LemA family protein [Bacteroidetes bacterium GWE2_40_63]OFY21438.1 MAG: LemA family protein [Bacteroidetes bacterium GWF2_40_13]OFZ25140.1 MAG: LemA family protein [Bacteroidetes bacterium RIFOXYC2_FULL_40_12]
MIVVGAILLFIIIIVSWYFKTFNRLVAMDENVQTQWAQVENVYQRRADLIPNLVNTVKGYASHENQTLTEIVEARAKATSVNINPEKLDAQSLQEFQSAQDGLSSALGRLMVIVENYPDLKANQNFRDLQAQLEGTENRISVERRNYNDAARTYNTTIRSFPASIVANSKGFEKKEYFKATEGAQSVPEVKF